MDLQQWKLLNTVPEQEDDEEEETLSLCDLALNNSTDSNGSFHEDQSSSFDDQDIFEFISSDFTTYPKDNIIFCGKMIPFKGDEEEEEMQNSINSADKSKKSFIFPWKYSYSFSSVKMEAEKTYRNCKTFPEAAAAEEKEEEEFPAKKGGRRGRSRWYLFAFGMGRYRGDQMELKDIKTRQSKMISDGKMRRSLKCYDEMEESGNEMSGKSEKKWWSLVRILGCQSSHANAMVKASLGLMPN